ncbi:MAG: aminoacyl-tRNA hydrolase [bacterium]|nr:MAG: aminoacyl-tRNA hydrolase [bacterium]
MGLTFLIVGLGNPGREYEQTRHNVGFIVVDFLASRFKKSFTKFHDTFWITSFKLNQQKIVLLKPATFMNLSGVAVALGIEQYDIDLSNLLVICDDINLKFGTIRIRSKGRDGGQKGLRSIISNLGTQDFPRLRIGIGDHIDDAADYVLSPFNSAEKKELSLIIQTAADTVESFVLNGIEFTMSRFNRNYLEN